MIPALLSVIIAFSVIAAAGTEIALTNFSIGENEVKNEQAFNVAEAGLNYYLWHLDHNETDYKDGQSTPTTPDPTLGYGPYVHNYIDADGVTEGTYTLWINPQGNGSTIVTVRSIGQAANTNIKRTVQAQIGSPSFASYGVVSDSALWFGANETADGPVESNQGVRIDGPNTSTISSANSTYTPSYSNGGCNSSNCSEPGVWCSSSVTTPVNCNTRSKSQWEYPVNSVDFNQVSNSLCTMKIVAFNSSSATSSLASQSNACTQVPSTRTSAYLPERSSSYSATRGYLIKLNNNNTYDLYDVNAQNDTLTPYTSALTLTSVATGISVPTSGVIFAEDNVWVVTPTTFNGRVSIAAGRLAATSSSSYANIDVAGSLLYAAKNGSDAIGLIAQNSIVVAPYAPPTSGAFTYEIDGALLAENGNVWYPEYYTSNTSECTQGWTNSNQQLLFYGSVATRQLWTWNIEWGGSCGNNTYDPSSGYYISGIENTTTQYDYNLEYDPPPSYPLTAGNNILSWREILTHP